MAGNKGNTSRRTRLRSKKFDENIEKRGKVAVVTTEVKIKLIFTYFIEQFICSYATFIVDFYYN